MYLSQVDISEVPDFNTMYELYDPCTVMFFFRNKHIMIDLGTGNNNKINWALKNKDEMMDIVETVYRGARKGGCATLVCSCLAVCLFLPFSLCVCVYVPPLCLIVARTTRVHAGRGLVVSPKDYSTKYKY